MARPKATQCPSHVHAGRPPPPVDEEITVFAGFHFEEIKVHVDTLCRGSEYFTAALGNEEPQVIVNEVEPQAMKNYIHWKYTGVVDVDEEDDREPSFVAWCRMSWLLDLYIASQFFRDYDAKNAVMDEIVKKVGAMKDSCVFYSLDVGKVWANTDRDSKLRQYVLDSWVLKGKADELKDWHYSPTFFLDLAIQHTKRRGENVAKLMAQRCMYHDHSNISGYDNENAALRPIKYRRDGAEELAAPLAKRILPWETSPVQPLAKRPRYD
ncbi:hypothetical protein LTR17_023750 [Elasticomyces elasticus]|nr:hypothetical protein LTR17_023750 [Elasticomyces elasticus]